ncbi:MAG TPA: DegT/DnrJ/EryC1/StrS aminotransferase family protein [Thermoanaerobaculia bacterium]|nr:DegT/DnrJ/EryC1/StrS aminotransferase family protein [Thermoanaerobaculia bacterium]HQR67738.1 DegT/DnrJ/EryC1/StrS aminotransferase family protein [Thermoanaerobaculia bacterium]
MAVDFYRHSLGEEEKKAVAAVLDSLFLTTGQRVYEFEAAFERFLGVPAVVCTSHGTASLHVSMLAAGIGPGDEVITTPMTFLSSANCVLYAGGTPVFADVDPVTANLDPAAVEAAITPRTKAIVAVDLYGLLADLPALRAIADRHGLVLVEDAAHCVEGRRDGSGPGQLADYACFSFYATKNLTCGEGGAISARDGGKKSLLRQLSTHGMSRNAADRYAGKYQHWDMERLGYKYNLSDVNASLLLSQLPKLAGRLARREAICRRYEAAFRETPGVSFPAVPAGAVSARHLFTIWVDPARRDAVLAGVQARGVGVAVNYRAVHLTSYYAERFGFRRGMFPVAERIGDATITIPLWPAMTDAQVDEVIGAVRAAVAAA